MKKHIITATALVALGLAPFAQGTILVYEPFDYTVGSNIGSVEASGDGLTGNWRLSFSSGAPASLAMYAKAWNTPGGYDYTPLNKRVGTPDDQTNSAAVNLAESAFVNFDQDGVVYYSYLLSYGAVTETTDNRSRVSFGSAATPDLMRVQGIGSGALRVYAGGDFNVGAALAADLDYLVVGRITTSAAETDEHRIWVYGAADEVALSDPGTTGSYASQSNEITGTASMLQFSNLQAASYGTFIMGTTWEAVVIPEPSTYAAIFGLAALGLLIVRRRRQRS